MQEGGRELDRLYAEELVKAIHGGPRTRMMHVGVTGKILYAFYIYTFTKQRVIIVEVNTSCVMLEIP